MTDGQEQDLLLFVAAQELVIGKQAAALLQITDNDATDLLTQLCAKRSVSRIELSSRRPAAYRITRHGADLVDGALPPLRPLSWSRYRHEIAIAWLWVSARHGKLGDLREVLTRRQMQAADITLRSESLLEHPGAAFSDQPATGPRLDARHAYPDLGLVQADGGWVAIEVVLTRPDPDRLKTMVSRISRDRLIRSQLYLVGQDGQIDEAIKTTAKQLGISDHVHVRLLARDRIAGA